jgi:hypothetical protein
MLTNRQPPAIDSMHERAVATNPISIRSTLPLGSDFQELIRHRFGRQLRHDAGLIERVTVRFEDVNGPKGGIDTMCRIKLVLTNRPSIIVEKLDTKVGPAFARALAAIGVAVRRVREKSALARSSATE